MRILITGAGGASAISIWKSLNNSHELYMADMDPCACGLYLVPNGRRFIIPRGDDPQLVSELLKICTDYKIDVLISTVDHELVPLALERDRFEFYGIKLPLPSVEPLQICRDKLALLLRLDTVVPVPNFSLLTQKSISEHITFPIFAKPRVSAGSRGAIIVKSRPELESLPRDESYLIQELLPGDEYSVDVYVSSVGQVIAAVPRLRMKSDSGIAVTARTILDQDLIDLAICAVQTLDLRYVSNVQFKRSSDGICKLLEINPRFPGTLPLTSASGVDMPKLLISDLMGLSLPDKLMSFQEVMVVRYWAEHYLNVNEWQDLCPP